MEWIPAHPSDIGMEGPTEKTAPLAECIRRADMAHAGEDNAAALEWYERAFRRLPDGGDAATCCHILQRTCEIRRIQGQGEAAEELCEAAAAIASLSGLRRQEGAALNRLAGMYYQRGNRHEADRLYARAELIAHEVSDFDQEAVILQNRGILASVAGDHRGAIRMFREAGARLVGLGRHDQAAITFKNLAESCFNYGDLEGATAAVTRAKTISERVRSERTNALIALVDAKLLNRQGRHEQAIDRAERAAAGLREQGSPSELAEVQLEYAAALRGMGRTDLAASHLDRGIRLAREAQVPWTEAELERERGQLAVALGDFRGAMIALNRAHRLFTSIDTAVAAAEVESRLLTLQTAYLEMASQWARPIEAKDPHGRGHGERVAEYAAKLASRMGREAHELTGLRIAAMLHDVGTLHLPPELLQKAEPLTPEERERIRQHPIEGAGMVRSLDLPWNPEPAIRHHHERWDGTGYPDRLREDEIPLDARIIAVADVFDALTTERPYRPARTPAAAKKILRDAAGSQLDPELVKLFLDVLSASGSTR